MYRACSHPIGAEAVAIYTIDVRRDEHHPVALPRLALGIQQRKRLAGDEFVVRLFEHALNHRNPIGHSEELAVVLAVNGNSLQYIEKVLIGGHFEIALLH